MEKYLFNSVGFLIGFITENDLTVDEFCYKYKIDKIWFDNLINSDYLQKEEQYLNFCKKIGIKFEDFFVKV